MKKISLIMLIVFTTIISADNLGFIGNPLLDYSPEAAKINTLKSFDNKLYLGFGDAGFNTGETDIIYFDPETNEFTIDGRVQDEAITQYCIIDSFLIIPGVDATESWDFGNIYFTSKNQKWTKHRTIPNGIHVFDAIKDSSSWLIGTGSFFNLFKDNDETLNAFGGIFSSDDKGETWNLSYATPSDNITTYRIKQLFKVGKEIYATFYGYYPVIPSELSDELKEKFKEVPLYQNYYLLLRNDIFGDSDLLHFKDGFWELENRLDVKNLAYSEFIPLGDKAIVTTYSGEKLPYQALGKHAKKQIFIFDNNSVTKANLPFDHIISHTKIENTTYCLVTKDKEFHLSSTTDFKEWKLDKLNTPLRLTSIESLGTELYFGEANGNIYRFNPKSKSTEFEFQAQRYQQGEKYFVKVTGWKNWAEKAILKIEQNPNKFSFKTDNINSFYLDLKDKNKDRMKFNIDGNKFSIKDLETVKSIKFEFISGKWKFTKLTQTFSELELIEPIIAITQLPETNIEEWQSELKSKSIFFNTDTDIVLCGTGFKDVLKSDSVKVSDIYRINYDNGIFTTELTGEEIQSIINEEEKCSYFSSEFVDPNDLKPDITYSVATTSYFFENTIVPFAQKFTETKTSVNKCMIMYFTKSDE